MKTEIETKDGTIYILPSGKRVLITHAQMRQLSYRVGWGITWRMVLAMLVAALIFGFLRVTLSAASFPPMPPRQKMIAKRVLQSPRESGVQVNAPMIRAEAVTLLPNSKLVWVANSSQDLIVNYTVWESQDLRTWRVIGTVTAPVGTATATEFDLGFSVFQTTKPSAFWRVSVAWKVGVS